MTDVTLRATKGSPLTHTEMDNNQVATRSGRKNLIIGGNFDTNPWQRGTAFSSIANGTYAADRFEWVGVGAGVVDIDKTADAPSVAQAGFNTNNCLEVDVTTVDASIASGDLYLVRTLMEGFDWSQIAQNDFVLSFWHKHTKTGTYCIGLKNSGNDRSYVAEYTQSVSDTWEKATIKVTASPSAGTWNYTTGVGVNINFTIAAGSTFHTTANAWNTGNFVATSNQVNALDSTSNFFRIALIQVEEGIEASDFERRSVGEETLLAQRYYEKSYNIDVDPATVTNTSSESFRSQGTAHVMTVIMQTPKRAAPTVITFSPSDGATGNWRDNGASTNRVAAATNRGHSRFKITITSSVDNNSMNGHWSADAEL